MSIFVIIAAANGDASMAAMPYEGPCHAKIAVVFTGASRDTTIPEKILRPVLARPIMNHIPKQKEYGACCTMVPMSSWAMTVSEIESMSFILSLSRDMR